MRFNVAAAGARRTTGVCGLAALCAASVLSSASDARAVGWLGTSATTPIEERVALSVSDTRTAAFYQLRFESSGGPAAIVIPVTDGAALDWSSRAFFEALESASAPRVLAPEAIDAHCPGDEPPSHVFGDIDGSVPIEPIELLVLADGPAVEAWATANGMSVPAPLSTAMGASPAGTHFFVARFEAPEGTSLTRTLRVVGAAPVASPAFSLDYTQAGASPLRVVTYAIGKNRALLSGASVSIDTADLALQAAQSTSNYEQLLFAAFADPPASPFLLDAASHEALRDNISLDDGGPVATGFVTGYFTRAATYGEALDRPSACITQAAGILDLSSRVGTACPRSSLGVVGGGAACTADDFQPGEVDPSLMRCGDTIDDLAVMLSDQEPDETWLTRSTIVLAPSTTSDARALTFPGGARKDPSLRAASVDLSGCPEGMGGMGAGGFPPSGSGPSTSSGHHTVEVPVYGNDGCSNNNTQIVDYVEVDESEAPDAYYSSEDCSGDTSGSYDAGGEDCSGDSGADYSAYDDTGCDCSDTGGDVDFDSEGCSCDGGDAIDCSGASDVGDGCDCSLKSRGRRAPRRMSAVLYAGLVFIIPIRRWSKKKKKK